jgi:hypothetical protein
LFCCTRVFLSLLVLLHARLFVSSCSVARASICLFLFCCTRVYLSLLVLLHAHTCTHTHVHAHACACHRRQAV